MPSPAPNSNKYFFIMNTGMNIMRSVIFDHIIYKIPGLAGVNGKLNSPCIGKQKSPGNGRQNSPP